MKHTIKNEKQEEVGWWNDQEEPRTYHTNRNFKKKQIFIHPKYNSAVGLDTRIIKKHLLPNNITRLNFLIINFEKSSFNAIIDLRDFLVKSKTVNFDKERKFGWSEQRILSLNEFQRVYPDQTTLN